MVSGATRKMAGMGGDPEGLNRDAYLGSRKSRMHNCKLCRHLRFGNES